MKRLSLLVLMLFSFAFALSVTSVAAQAGETYYVKTASARVRDSADTHGAVVATIRRNTAVQVLDVVDGTKVSKSTVWYHIQLADGTEGYIHSSLVTDKAPLVRSTPTPAPDNVTTSTVTTEVTPAPPQSDHPAGATAKCNDGTYSYAAHHQGACSHHHGVAVFYT